MKITEIIGFQIEGTLPRVQGNSIGFVERRPTLLVCLKTDSGLCGWGETWHSPKTAAAIIQNDLASAVLGADPLNRNRIWHELAARRGYDRRGQTMMAISAIDLALWDIAARSFGVPVWSLLGGKLRDRVLAYGSGPYFRLGDDPYAEYEAEIEQYLDAGFKAVKLRIGTTPEKDRRICLKARELIGPDGLLMVDLNQGFGLRSGLAIANAIAEAGIYWIEEPLLPDDLDGYRRFQALSPVPVAAGEALVGVEAYRDLLTDRLVDVVQPDLAICGGLSEAVRIGAMASATDVEVAAHIIGSPLNLYAGLHFSAILPSRPSSAFKHRPLLEYDRTPDISKGTIPLPDLARDGTVAVPDGLGWGVDLEPHVLAEIAAETWTLRS